MAEINVYPDAEHLAQAAAEHFIECAKEAIASAGRFSVALSGGSTPRAFYELLATEPYARLVEWEGVFIFWGDERCVPPDHPDSCYWMAKQALLDKVPVPSQNIFRIRGEIDPAQAASEYEQNLRSFFGERARFDLIWLGMGDDGHTASLFPGTAALNEQERWVVENYVEVKKMWRVTLTAPTINAAANVAFLVSGKEKAERLRQVLKGPNTPRELPAQIVNPSDGQLIWMVDASAARLL